MRGVNIIIHLFIKEYTESKDILQISNHNHKTIQDQILEELNNSKDK